MELESFYNYGKKSKIEESEDIEILRFLELNIKIKNGTFIETKPSCRYSR